MQPYNFWLNKQAREWLETLQDFENPDTNSAITDNFGNPIYTLKKYMQQGNIIAVELLDHFDFNTNSLFISLYIFNDYKELSWSKDNIFEALKWRYVQ
jgi:hypothetical protein